MPPRSPLAGLSEIVQQAGKSVVEALKGVLAPIESVRTWAEDRIDRAMTCPECGHGSALDPVVRAEQAEACDCTDELCVCNDEVEYGEQPR